MIFNMSTGGASTADKVKYNNTKSGLQSTDVQGAIDEVNSSLESIKIKTLWTNPELDGDSNLSEFNPQTININGISEYDIIGICHSTYAKTSCRFNFTLNIPNKINTIDLTYSDEVTGYQFRGYNRAFTILENGISFEDGYDCAASSRSKSNKYAIPIKIMGIKL